MSMGIPAAVRGREWRLWSGGEWRPVAACGGALVCTQKVPFPCSMHRPGVSLWKPRNHLLNLRLVLVCILVVCPTSPLHRDWLAASPGPTALRACPSDLGARYGAKPQGAFHHPLARSSPGSLMDASLLWSSAVPACHWLLHLADPYLPRSVVPRSSISDPLSLTLLLLPSSSPSNQPSPTTCFIPLETSFPRSSPFRESLYYVFIFFSLSFSFASPVDQRLASGQLLAPSPLHSTHPSIIITSSLILSS